MHHPRRGRVRAAVIPKRKIASNAFWQLVDKCTRAALGFVLFAATARSLGAEAFGQFALTMAIVSLISPLATLSIDRITVRDFVAEPGETDLILSDTLIMRLGGAVFGSLIAVTVGFYLYGADIGKWTAIGSLVSVVQSLNVIDDYYQAHMNSKRVAWVKLLALAIACVVRGILVYSRASVVWFVWAVVLEAAVLYLIILICYLRDRGPVRLLSPRMAFIRSRFQECWPLMVSGLAYFAYMRLPQLTLARVRGETEVGYYAVALRLAEGAVPLVHAIAASLFPAMVQLYNSNKVEYLATYEKWTAILACASFGVLLPAALSSGFLIRVIYGPSYSEAAVPLSVVLVCLWIMIVTVFRAGYLTLAGLQRHLLLSCIVGVCLAAIISKPVIERYGASGAALTYLVVQAAVLLGVDLVSKRTRAIALIHLRSMLLLGCVHIKTFCKHVRT